MLYCVYVYHKEKNSRFSNTANYVNRKTVDSSGIWTRTFGNTGTYTSLVTLLFIAAKRMFMQYTVMHGILD